jgi:hypothetical protein
MNFIDYGIAQISKKCAGADPRKTLIDSGIAHL